MGPLDQLFGNRGGGSRIPIVNLALLGLLGYRTLKGKGKLADLFNMNRQPDAAGAPAGQAPSTGLDGILRGGLGGLLGAGGLGGLLNGGLRDLVDRFQQKGMSNVADSWVSRGDNRRITAVELEQALGSETVDDLAANAGIPREQLLAELSSRLPEVVDKLTPEGRVPTEAEANEWVAQSTRPGAPS
jgi:uncharacterized protein YidB (DUF937 family)